jgi:hypothetical protein
LEENKMKKIFGFLHQFNTCVVVLHYKLQYFHVIDFFPVVYAASASPSASAPYQCKCINFFFFGLSLVSASVLGSGNRKHFYRGNLPRFRGNTVIFCYKTLFPW